VVIPGLPKWKKRGIPNERRAQEACLKPVPMRKWKKERQSGEREFGEKWLGPTK